jgi:hypothetical protein
LHSERHEWVVMHKPLRNRVCLVERPNISDIYFASVAVSYSQAKWASPEALELFKLSCAPPITPFFPNGNHDSMIPGPDRGSKNPARFL